jgi:acetyl-CoA carboxylase biotin carboxyl carrier protein
MAAKRSPANKKSPPKHKAPAARSSNRASDADRLEKLERLIELMVEKDVVEVELEEGGSRWRVRRTEPHHVTYAAPPMGMSHHGGSHPAPLAAAGPTAGPSEPEGEVFKSPMLGTFYQAPSPDAEPFVKVGDRVTADQTVCIIEAMKVMNEIKAERDFEVLEILVKNGEPVEYGQPMFLIR